MHRLLQIFFLFFLLHVALKAQSQQRTDSLRKTPQNNYSYYSAPDRFSPALAGVASYFIPGLGQIYCGETKRGIKFLFGTLGCATIMGVGFFMELPYLTGGYNEHTTLGTSMMLGGMLGTVGMMGWSVVDAIKLAKTKNLAARNNMTGFLLDISPYTSMGTGKDAHFGITASISF